MTATSSPIPACRTASSSRSESQVRPPQEVRVFVLNGSGVTMAAATKANELRGLGYAIAGTGSAPIQTGVTVACREGFDKEAGALSGALRSSTQVISFPSTPPAGSENADCIVTLGQ